MRRQNILTTLALIIGLTASAWANSRGKLSVDLWLDWEAVQSPQISPDGSQIAYRAAGKDGQGLFVITLATGTIRALTADSSHDNFPAWSPKGDRIAFTRFTDSDYELYTIKPNGSDVRRLTNKRGNDAHCAWSPDGEWLAFSSARGGFKDEAALHPGNPQPYADIYVMRADGSDIRQLTDTPFEEGTVSWAPRHR